MNNADEEEHDGLRQKNTPVKATRKDQVKSCFILRDRLYSACARLNRLGSQEPVIQEEHEENIDGGPAERAKARAKASGSSVEAGIQWGNRMTRWRTTSKEKAASETDKGQATERLKASSAPSKGNHDRGRSSQLNGAPCQTLPYGRRGQHEVQSTPKKVSYRLMHWHMTFAFQGQLTLACSNFSFQQSGQRGKEKRGFAVEEGDVDPEKVPLERGNNGVDAPQAERVRVAMVEGGSEEEEVQVRTPYIAVFCHEFVI